MTTKATLGELTTLYPLAAKVFHSYGLDYCCGGAWTLEDACREKHLSPEDVLAEISREEGGEAHHIQWEQQPLGELIDYIVARFHDPLREELPRLIDLVTTVEQVQAEMRGCPNGLHCHLAGMKDAVESHLAKEEQVLFPLIKSGRTQGIFYPIQVMMKEHVEHGEDLRKTREMTKNFYLPAEACATWGELYRSLEQLERDLMEHIHLENNILFPRVRRPG